MSAALLLVALAAATPTSVKADDGHPLTVWVKQGGKKPIGTLVLVHGRTWSAVPDFDLPGYSTLDALAARGYTVYAIDLRGYGKTPRDASGWFTVNRGAADVLAVIATLKQKPVLLGWSMGSLVSQLVAQQAPDKLAGVVLYGYPWDPDAKNDNAEPTEPQKKPNTAEAAAEDFIVPGTPKPLIDAYVKSALQADPVRVDLRERSQLAALDGAKLTVPTLIIQGEKDPYATTAVISKLWAKLGASHRQWVVLPATDHAAHLEKPAAFIDAVVAFERSLR